MIITLFIKKELKLLFINNLMSENNKRRSPFMTEFNPHNPYGVNYIDHPYTTKLFYKYN